MIKIGKVLEDAGLVKAKDVELALEQQKLTGKFLGHVLVEMGKITEADLLRCLSKQMHIPFVSLKEMTISKEVIQKIPVKYAWHYRVMPVKFEDGVVSVALSNPLNLWPLEDMKQHLQMDIEPVIACTSEIEEAIRKYYGVGADTIEKIISKDEEKLKTPSITIKGSGEDIEKLAGDASVIRLVNEIVKEGIESRATDIHFERYDNELLVRYRIDGMLQKAKISDDIKFLYSAIVARIKVMSSLDIVERRVPQSGAAHIRMGSNEYDLRVSVIPDNYGEGVVIRILPSEMLIDLNQLGMPEKDMKLLESFIHRSHGVIYVTGPTGSGKTTTLYACLNRLNKPNIKISSTIAFAIEEKIRRKGRLL